MNYIGTDIHISTLDFKVVGNLGKVKMAREVTTSAPNFLDFIKSVPAPRQVIIEEGPLAAWLLEICDKNGEHLIISDPKRNKWIGASGEKEDPIDAEKLAQLAQQDILVGLEYFLYPEPQRNRIFEVFKDKNPVAHTCLTALRERVAQTTIKTPTGLFLVAEQIKSHIIKYGEKNAIGQLNLLWKALDIQFIGANPAPLSIMTNYLS